jgi:hypothetical protein
MARLTGDKHAVTMAPGRRPSSGSGHVEKVTLGESSTDPMKLAEHLRTKLPAWAKPSSELSIGRKSRRES